MTGPLVIGLFIDGLSGVHGAVAVRFARPRATSVEGKLKRVGHA